VPAPSLVVRGCKGCNASNDAMVPVSNVLSVDRCCCPAPVAARSRSRCLSCFSLGKLLARRASSTSTTFSSAAVGRVRHQHA
jgi:hypothetical protein